MLVGVLVVLPIVVVASALVALSGLTARRIAGELGDQYVRSATERVEEEVREYLSHAVRTAELYERRVRAGLLPTTGLGAWERAMLDDLAVCPDVASICFGNTSGDATWLLRGRHGLEIGRVDGASGGRSLEFLVDPDSGRVEPEPLRVYTYDPRLRPWWKAALDAGGPVWTPVYFWFGEGLAESDRETGSGFARPVRDARGELLGVLVIDVTLGAFSEFLGTLPIAEKGHAYIVDGQGLLVAASDGAVMTPRGERLALNQAPAPAAQAVAAAVARNGGGLTQFRVRVDGGPARAEVKPLSPYPGIDWRVVAVIPESAFLGGARAMERQGVLMGLVAVAGALVLGLLLSRELTRPILALTEHVRRVGAGDFASRVDLAGARELRLLSDELNKAAGGLKQRMELEQSLGVAMEVQQSLLPRGVPSVPGVDLAGHSRYCDSTGGDYFDFLELSAVPGQGVLAVVGDVMGHGVAAALLMATARAALRASVAREGSLGEIMTGVNGVLARDARHGRFMTMTLLFVEPGARRARWASAGHDPTLVYDPAADSFDELSEGDIPMGLVEGLTYEEYTRDGLPERGVLLIGTDGIWEARNAQGEPFGKDRLREVVRRHAGDSAQAISEAIAKAHAEFLGIVAIQDDVTFVVARLG